jgi:predicted AlkP superfamily pyrophosphatase or phosphodiesterase
LSVINSKKYILSTMARANLFSSKGAQRLRLYFFVGLLGGVLLGSGSSARGQGPPLLVMISVDGMRPDCITAADAHGAKVPNLRRFLKEGTYADGVTGVVPTVTFPSHTTLVTGVWPAKHGILANTTFDPLRQSPSPNSYWYAEDIRAPTLWDAATAVGRTTASVDWPVTVGADITWNIPAFWVADAKLLRAVSTRGLLKEARVELGDYDRLNDTPAQGDENRGRYAQWILEKKHPALLTLHLGALDDIEHQTGPFSPESLAVLETIDGVIGKIRDVAEKLAPGRAYIAVVSDHGFVRADTQLNVIPLFREAKLISVNDNGKIMDWKAMPWMAAGSIAVVLKDPSDATTLAQVRELLVKLAGDPANGIDRVVEADELHKRGGFPPASFFVNLKPGWRTGAALDGPVVSKTAKVGGTHGAWPDLPELRSSFFLVGPGVPAGKSLGVIDMRDVAPTLAHEVGLTMPTADGKVLLP